MQALHPQLRWMKSPLIVQAQQADLADFLVYAGTSYALLVDVVDPDSALAKGLFAALSDEAELHELSWATELSEYQEPAVAAGARRVMQAVPADFINACCFALAVRKRDPRALPGRVLVGRANDQDVVLLDSSVSRLHGWFETNSRGRLVVSDGGSSNGIRVNRAAVAGQRELTGGEVLHFGRVRACVCPLDKFWSLARGT